MYLWFTNAETTQSGGLEKLYHGLVAPNRNVQGAILVHMQWGSNIWPYEQLLILV